MAVTGKFLADFSAFYDAVQKADVALKGFETGAGKVESALNRMTNSFSGTQIIQQATLTAEAVERIGGAAKLTEAEQRRVNATVTEAIDKYKALGQVAPKSMTDLAEATSKANREAQQAPGILGQIGSSLAALGPAIAATFSVQALLSFGKELLDTADHITKLSDKLSITTDEVQKLDYIASQSGNTVDDLAGAMSKMQDLIGSGNEGLLGVLKATGISLEELKTKSPFEQMGLLATEIAKVEDPAKRAAMATDAFGAKGREIMPSLIANFKELGDEAPIMDQRAVKALDSVGDGFSRLWMKIKAGAGNALATLQEMQAGAESFQYTWADVFAKLDTPPPAPKGPKRPTVEGPALPKVDVGELEQALNRARDALDKAAEADKRRAAAIQQVRDQLFGQDAIAKAKQYVAALGPIANLSRVAEDDQKALNKAMGEAIEAYARAGQVAPAAMNQIYVMTARLPPAVDGLTSSMRDLGTEVKVTLPTLYELPKIAMATSINFRELGTIVSKPEIPEFPKKIAVNLKDLSSELTNLATISGSTFGSLARGLSTIVSAASSVQTAFGNLKAGMAGFSSGQFLGGLTNMASGILGIASAALAAGRAIAGMFGESAAVQEAERNTAAFEQTLWDTLSVTQKLEAGNEPWKMTTIAVRDAYLAVGKTAEDADAVIKALWDTDNPERSKRAIQEINAVLDEQKRKAGDAADAIGDVTEAQAKATIETASEAAKALEDLAPRIKDNETAWREWGDVVTGQIDQIADALRALQLPTLSGAAVTQPPMGGAAVGAAGAAVAAVAGGDTHIYLDGEVIARSTARHLPRVFGTVGV